MSGAAVQALQDNEKTDARRFCGYPAYGAGASGFQSWRFFTAYGTLEYRLANLAMDELTVVRAYLGQLTELEAATFSAGANLDTDQASVWRRNRDEVRDRDALFTTWRLRLVGFLGVPPGPALSTSYALRI